MGVNLENRHLRRQHQQQPTSGWSRRPDVGRLDQPVRIYTLGRFSIQLEGHPLYGKQVRQGRPVELLQALISLGGRDVGLDTLAQALWPDTDGDLARNNVEVTLHRLRRLFGVKNLLLLHDQRLSLNSGLGWVDAWSFERLVNHAERLLPLAADPVMVRQLARVGERLMALYQGNFLERETTSTWPLRLRERLRSKLMRHILGIGRVWERVGEWERAATYYRRGLEIDPLTEALYQRLMICCRETGHYGDAIAAYLRCETMLASHFDIKPSPATQSLFCALKR